MDKGKTEKKDQKGATRAPLFHPTRKHQKTPKNTKKVRPAPTKHDFRMVILYAIWSFASFIVAEFAVSLLFVWLMGVERASQPIWMGVMSLLSYGLALAFLFFAFPWLAEKMSVREAKAKTPFLKSPPGDEYGTNREELGLSGLLTWTDVGLSLVGFFVGTALAGILLMFFNNFAWFDAGQVQQTGFSTYLAGGERMIAFVILVVAAPIMEEIIFRGWLYGKLRSKISAPVAILITSLLFGAAHFQWNVGVNVFALSVVLCTMREITGTIYAGILTHIIKNGVAFYAMYVLGF